LYVDARYGGAMTEPPRQDFLDVGFDRLDEQAVVAQLAMRRATDDFAYLVTPNVDHVVRLSKQPPDASERRAYADAHWCLCDSRVLARLAAMKGIDLPVVPGSDLTARLFADIVVSGDRICLVGGDERTVSDLARLRPDLDIVQHVPPMGLRSDPAARAVAARFAADMAARFTLVAVGSPQQELVAQAIGRIGGATGTALCIGASIDFLTGRERRAPRWVQAASLEWLYRLSIAPQRMWRRYLVEGPRIFWLVWRWRISSGERSSADRPGEP
jgi:N-acetylglucosaminyldiphosphoundecaprenol N-acetyl-beta-D-mannosaminyltransferase